MIQKDVPLSLLSEYRRNLSIQVAISEEDTFASVMAPPTLALFCMDVTGSVIRSELIALPYSSLADVYRQATMGRKSHSLYPTIGQKEVLSDTNITTSVTAPVNHLFLCMDVKGCLIRPEMIEFYSRVTRPLLTITSSFVWMLRGVLLTIFLTDNGLVNSGFEVGPTFLNNSSQGILLESDWNNDPYKAIQSPLQQWDILGIVKYIDSKHFAVPRGRGAIELISGSPSGIVTNIYFLRHGQVTLDFIMGDANDSCVGDLTVYVQVQNMVWNFTTRSTGVGSSERHSVTFKAEFSNTESVPISFHSFNETRTSDNRTLCGPVIDSTRLQFLSYSRSEKMHTKFMNFSFVLTVLFLFVL